MKPISIISAVLLTAAVFSSCKKDPGPAGPAGPAGNANVIHYSVTVAPWQWSYDAFYSHWDYQYSCTADNESAVLMYVMGGNGKQAMPWYNSFSNVQYDFATNLFATPSHIEFQYTNFTSNTTAPTSDEYFYVVIIPPAIRAAHPDLDYSNYEEVKRTFSLR